MHCGAQAPPQDSQAGAAAPARPMRLAPAPGRHAYQLARLTLPKFKLGCYIFMVRRKLWVGSTAAGRQRRGPPGGRRTSPSTAVPPRPRAHTALPLTAPHFFPACPQLMVVARACTGQWMGTVYVLVVCTVPALLLLWRVGRSPALTSWRAAGEPPGGLPKLRALPAIAQLVLALSPAAQAPWLSDWRSMQHWHRTSLSRCGRCWDWGSGH